jgi:predicted nucleic acid-binding protein
MGKTQVILDTSAVISLGCTSKFHLIGKVFGLHSPMRVKEELEEISKRDDEIGRIAKRYSW